VTSTSPSLAPTSEFAHVLALTYSLERAVVAARRAASAQRKTVYIGEATPGSNTAHLGKYVVWTPIGAAEASKLTYDSKLHAMPWLRVDEMAKWSTSEGRLVPAHALYAFESPAKRRR
jgi:hypothetical protein